MKCHNINLVAAGACLICGILYTVIGLPIATITMLVVAGLVNLAFVLGR